MLQPVVVVRGDVAQLLEVDEGQGSRTCCRRRPSLRAASASVLGPARSFLTRTSGAMFCQIQYGQDRSHTPHV